MPNRKHSYKDMDKFKQTRKKQRQRYYDKTAVYEPNMWTVAHNEMVLKREITDAELSKLIGHSVRAIQVQRSRLKSKLIE